MGSVTAFTKYNWPKERWPNFSFDEMRCKHTGLCYLDVEFMDELQRLRNMIGIPLSITSGYRHATHPAEAKKKGGPGSHNRGCAVDVAIYGGDCWNLLNFAGSLEFVGIGLKQTGPHNERFVHLDQDTQNPRPTVWTY